jgi:hypothetical protein
MKKSYKALLYNFLGFAPIFLILYFVIAEFTGLTGLWIPAVSFIASTLLAPKFQCVKHMGEEKIFVGWLFFKGAKEVKF